MDWVGSGNNGRVSNSDSVAAFSSTSAVEFEGRESQHTGYYSTWVAQNESAVLGYTTASRTDKTRFDADRHSPFSVSGGGKLIDLPGGRMSYVAGVATLNPLLPDTKPGSWKWLRWRLGCGQGPGECSSRMDQQ